MQWADLIKFKVHCELAGVNVPPPIERGLDLVDLARAAPNKKAGGLLDLTDGEVDDRVVALAIRGHSGISFGSSPSHVNGLATGVEAFEEDLLAEVVEATLPHLDQIIVDLRPRFEEAAAPLVIGARDFGFTWETTSDQVIRRRDPAAAAAWADIPGSYAAMSPFERLRVNISRLFEVSPTRPEMLKAQGLHFTDGDPLQDYSVCFAGDVWNINGHHYITAKRNKGQSLGQINWLALAAGGLRLNTPAEVREKLRQRERGLKG